MRRVLSPIILIIVTGSGCAHFDPVTTEQLERGYVLLLPGVANRPTSMLDIARGLRDAGVDQAIIQDRWGDYPFGDLKNVMALQRNRGRAAERAIQVANYRRSHPQTPITVIGHSGGGAMALFVCETLPEEVQVDRIVLLAAAVSPGYDLTAARRRCRRGIINYYSPGDWFDGGVLTVMCGTMDRKHTSTAGRLGFLDSEGRLLAAEGLTQICWTPRWREYGHNGGHLGWGTRRWASQLLGPLVIAGLPTED